MIYLRPLHCKEHGLSATNGMCRLCLAIRDEGQGGRHPAYGVRRASDPTPCPSSVDASK
jgi:hypothetical protein